MQLVTAERYSAEQDEKRLGEYGTEMKLSASTDLVVSDRQVAEEVRQKLGYGALETRINREERIQNDEQNLLAVLREHGISFYRPSEIKEYQARMLKAATRENWVATTAFCTCLALFIGSIVWAALTDDIASAVLMGVSFIGGVAGGFWAFPLWDRPIHADWSVVELEMYRKPVPKDALMKALPLADVPQAHFTVEDLKRDRGESRILRMKATMATWDPLLFVHIGHARFCIAMWDEPEFTGRLVH